MRKAKKTTSRCHKVGKKYQACDTVFVNKYRTKRHPLECNDDQQDFYSLSLATLIFNDWLMDWYQISHVLFLFLFLEISKFLLKFWAKYLINIWQPMHSAIMNSITDLFIFSTVMKSKTIRLNIFDYFSKYCNSIWS